MFKFTDACIFYGWIKSELGQIFDTNIFPRVSIHYAATSLKPGSALGEKGDKNRLGQKKKKIWRAAKGCESRVKKLRTEATK